MRAGRRCTRRRCNQRIHTDVRESRRGSDISSHASRPRVTDSGVVRPRMTKQRKRLGAAPLLILASGVTATMQAARYRCYGDTDVIQGETVVRPVPSDISVLVRVHAAATNPLDWHDMRGKPYIMRLSSGFGRPSAARVLRTTVWKRACQPATLPGRPQLPQRTAWSCVHSRPRESRFYTACRSVATGGPAGRNPKRHIVHGAKRRVRRSNAPPDDNALTSMSGVTTPPPSNAASTLAAALRHDCSRQQASLGAPGPTPHAYGAMVLWCYGAQRGRVCAESIGVPSASSP